MQRQQSGGRTKAGIFLVGSVLLALLAGFLVFGVVKKVDQTAKEAARPKETVDVVIAQRDLYMGLPIGNDDVVLRQIEPDMVPREGIFHKLADIVGRTPRERILANEPIREERLARPDAGIGLNAIVTPGKRAMTVATDTEQAVAGLLQAGNYVDIIVTIKPDDPEAMGAKWVADTILQGIKVLAVGGQLNTPTTTSAESKPGDASASKKSSGTSSDPNQSRRLKPSITLEVTPEEAEKLALAESQGDIHVVLRSDIDILQIAENPATTAKDLIGLPAAAAGSAPKPDRPSGGPKVEEKEAPKAEVISGGSKQTVTFQDDGTTTVTSEKGGAAGKKPGKSK